MFSEKTTEMLRLLKTYRFTQKSIATVKHSSDQRYAKDGRIYTHSKESVPAQYTVTDLWSIIDDLRTYQVVAIDEGHFFPEVAQVCQSLANDRAKPRHVIISGLCSDYKQKPFSCMSELIACADRVTHLNAVCEQCYGDAPFTVCVSDTSQMPTNAIRVGAHETYQARCRRCILDEQ
jgi:thymidine kinase